MADSATHVMIATPAYNGQVHTDYVHSLMKISNTGLNFALQTVGNDSLVTRARNALIANFWHLDEFSHLLFLDADVYLDAEGLLSMITHDKDVIGAPVYLKGKDDKGNQTLNTDAEIDRLPTLQVANRVGSAVLLLSRRAVGALVDDAVRQQRVYKPGATYRCGGIADEHYDIFRTEVVNQEYLSEDYSVCYKLRALGYEIYVDTSVYTRHNGMVAFD